MIQIIEIYYLKYISNKKYYDIITINIINPKKNKEYYNIVIIMNINLISGLYQIIINKKIKVIIGK